MSNNSRCESRDVYETSTCGDANGRCGCGDPNEKSKNRAKVTHGGGAGQKHARWRGEAVIEVSVPEIEPRYLR